MPGEVIDRPNPPPLPSQLPSSVEELFVHPPKMPLSSDISQSLSEFQQTACYIASGWYLMLKLFVSKHSTDLCAAMIFLKDNVLLERDLVLEDVKPRLLGK